MNPDELVQLRELVPDHNREEMAASSISLPKEQTPMPSRFDA
jgi:hypothetical protein